MANLELEVLLKELTSCIRPKEWRDPGSHVTFSQFDVLSNFLDNYTSIWLVFSGNMKFKVS